MDLRKLRALQDLLFATIYKYVRPPVGSLDPKLRSNEHMRHKRFGGGIEAPIPKRKLNHEHALGNRRELSSTIKPPTQALTGTPRNIVGVGSSILKTRCGEPMTLRSTFTNDLFLLGNSPFRH